VNKLANAGIDFGVFLTGFAEMLRAMLTVVLNGRAEGVSSAAAASLAERKDLFTAGDLLRMISAVNALEPTFRKSGQQQLLIEMLLVRMALIDRTVAIEDLLRGLEGGGGSSGGQRTDAPSGAVRASAPQAAVARTVQRPATRPGYPPQLPTPNALPSDRAPAAAPPQNDTQLNEMKRAMEATAQDSNRSRMTPEALKEERIGMLRQKDPALGAAIDELDLELLD
jgi:DNA polymerase-3 subunit gamma/tau